MLTGRRCVALAAVAALAALPGAGLAADSGGANDAFPDNQPHAGSAVIKGLAQVGETLAVEFDGAVAHNADVPVQKVQPYGWLRCDAEGLSCQGIAGANEPTYQVVAGDVSATLRATVRTYERGGAYTVLSPPTALVAPGGPPGSTPPVAQGTQQQPPVTTNAPAKTEPQTTPLSVVFFAAPQAAAGRTFTARLRVPAASVRDSASVRVRCAARLDGKPLRATLVRFAAGSAQCSWRLPAGAEGKRIAGTVRVLYRGKAVQRSFSRRVASY
ncbi:MAG: hypothetical protein ABR583_02650 [Gaiellaceae bacterium]